MSRLITPNNSAPYWTGYKSISKYPFVKSNFMFKKWWRDGLFRSDRFYVDINNFSWGEFPSYKYNFND